MRAFVAFDLPETVREELADAVERFRNLAPRGVNWVPPQNLHITLLFLGDVPSSQIPRVDSAASELLAGVPAFELTNPRVEIKPSHRPRIIWVRFDTHISSVFKLPGKLRDALAPLGLEIDAKPLKLHCTLGRIKAKPEDEALAEMLQQAFQTRRFTVEQASLYESRLHPQGPVYAQVCGYSLPAPLAGEGGLLG